MIATVKVPADWWVSSEFRWIEFEVQQMQGGSSGIGYGLKYQVSHKTRTLHFKFLNPDL